MFRIWVYLLVERLVWYGARISRHLQVVLPRCEHTARGLLRLMAHQPIKIDCAGADGRGGGAGSAEPGLSTDQGSVEASVEQVAVPSAPPRPSARDKAAVRYRVEKYLLQQLNYEPFLNRLIAGDE